MEKEMATHSSILAWRIPWTEEPGGLQSTGSQRGTRLSDFTSLWMSEYISALVLLGRMLDSTQIHYCEWASDVIFVNQKCDFTIVIVTVLFPGGLLRWFAQYFHFCLLLGTEEGHTSQTLGWS